MIIPFHIVVAYDQQMGIGYENDLPWKLKKDLIWFKKLTCWSSRKPDDLPNCVVMGYHTWESIPLQFRPLRQRLNIILSRRHQGLELPEKTTPQPLVCSDFVNALEEAQKKSSNIFIVGGRMVYREALHHPGLQTIYATEIEHTYRCDKKFPEFKNSFRQKKRLFSDREDQICFSVYHYSQRR